MPRSGYDMTNIPDEDRPAWREEQSPPTASSSSFTPSTIVSGNNPSTRHQAGELPTIRLSPGYITNTGGYTTFNQSTGRGWRSGPAPMAPTPTPTSVPASPTPTLTTMAPPPIPERRSSYRAAPGSGSAVLAGEASRVLGGNNRSGRNTRRAPPPPPPPSQATLQAGYLVPRGERHLVRTRRRIAREAPVVQTIVPGAGFSADAAPVAAAASGSSGSASAGPSVILTAPSSSSEEEEEQEEHDDDDDDVEMGGVAAAASDKKGKGKAKA